MLPGCRSSLLIKWPSIQICPSMWCVRVESMRGVERKALRFITTDFRLPKETQEKQQKWNSNKRTNTYSYSSFTQIAYFGVCVSVGFSIYHFLKHHQHFKYVSLSKLHNFLIPPLYAAAPIFNPKPNNEDQNNTTKKSNRSSCNFIADVVEKVTDGVVFIEIKDHRRRDYKGKNLAISNGSGFIIDSAGLILTNAHVVANKPRTSTIMVQLADGKEYEGVIEELDVISDLALVRIKKDNLKTLTLGNSKDVRPGEFVVALGSPLSLSNTITSGVISSIGRPSKDLGLRGRDINYIQTDAAITFGNSGGPLVNLDGEVIGINSMKVTSGISFAIPVDYAKEFLEKAEKKRAFMGKHKDKQSEEIQTKRRYLGVTMLTLTPEIIAQMQQRTPGSPVASVPDHLTHGILVWKIVVGSPGYHAGLEPGDIVTHINGHEITSSRDVYKLLESKCDLNMVVVRKGDKYSVSVCPEE